MIAPDLLRSEVGNALWKKVQRQEIDALQAAAAFAAIEGLLTFLPTESLAGRALEIALAIRHPVYDCVYLALAETTGIRVLTADRKLILTCRSTSFAGCLVALDEVTLPDL